MTGAISQEQLSSTEVALFRRVMGRFTTGVTVITAEIGGYVRGMTANAFMSASLSPPLCIISVATKARLHDALLKASYFGVSILAQEQEAISLHFSGRGAERSKVDFEYLARVPVLRRASAVIAARIEKSYDCGDHTLFVGHIMQMRDDNRTPLVYQSGRYGTFVPFAEQAGGSTIEFW